jgi:hypothetical protein
MKTRTHMKLDDFFSSAACWIMYHQRQIPREYSHEILLNVHIVSNILFLFHHMRQFINLVSAHSNSESVLEPNFRRCTQFSTHNHVT